MKQKNYYRHYRGRRSKGKAALAAFLVLVILAAVVVIVMQRNVVYDETGAPRLEVPWQDEGENETAPSAELDLVIQTPAKETETFYGCSVPVPLNRETWSRSLRQAQDVWGEQLNTVVVTMKAPGGNVYFDSALAAPGAVQFLPEETGAALEALLSEGSEHELRAVAVFSCFPDSHAAKSSVDTMGLQDTSGYIFYDSSNGQWLDPAKAEARAYLCSLACEVAELGFDELLLSDVTYPVAGNLEGIAYGEGDRSEHLSLFLEELRAALAPYGVKVSLKLPAEVILAGEDEVSGVRLAELAGKVDRIFADTTPDGAPALAAAVAAAAETAEFVPVLRDCSPPGGNCLIESDV